MTRFAHQQHSGRGKRGKRRQRRRGLEIRSHEALLEHRELAFLRNPSWDRARKLTEAKRSKARAA